MMTTADLQFHFLQLGLTTDEAAQLLSVSPRTVQRWQHGIQEVPGPAEQALRAWMGLHERGLAWRPDEVSLTVGDAEQIAIARTHAVELDALLKRVEARSGPSSAPWTVDLERGRAILGSLEVSFYRLKNGGFAPQSYRRSDEHGTDLRRDWHLIEDAYACIARAFAKQGQPLRQRLAFMGPSLDKGTLFLWETSLTPPVVAKLDCQTLRAALGLDPQVSDEKCRLLADRNKDVLSEIAEAMFAAQRFEVGALGIRVLSVGCDDLKPVAARFARGVLDIEAQWGVR